MHIKQLLRWVFGPSESDKKQELEARLAKREAFYQLADQLIKAEAADHYVRVTLVNGQTLTLPACVPTYYCASSDYEIEHMVVTPSRKVASQLASQLTNPGYFERPEDFEVGGVYYARSAIVSAEVCMVYEGPLTVEPPPLAKRLNKRRTVK